MIKDINKVSNNFTCGECQVRFTKSCNLIRHTSSCKLGQTNTKCLGSKILAPESSFEKAFFPEGHFGTEGVRWLVYLSQNTGKHIHHHKCGHGGERVIKGHPVDGYHPETKTVYQFHGCHWHGCIQCFPNPEQRTEVIRTDKNGKQTTRELAYIQTFARSEQIRHLGYNLVERWEHEQPSPWLGYKLPRKQNETYPHAIVYDFESYQDKTKASNPTRDLSYESEHVPISVSIADTINTEPEYICSRDPDELISLFYQSLVQRQRILQEDAEERYLPSDFGYLPKKQQNLIKQWCGQVPVIGFNSDRYDLNLIRKHFISHLGEEHVESSEKQGQIMFMKTSKFNFLDVTNYLSPGTSYDKWVKTYGVKQTKSWLPYEWFDSAAKLDYEGLPPYRCWFSKLKNILVLKPKEYNQCARVFQEQGMQTFGDWLEYYNKLDVTPFLEALEKMYSIRWFGFAEVNIEVPRDLWEEIEEFPPIIINQSDGEEGIPQHMKDYLAHSGRTAMPNQKKLLGVLKAKKGTSVRPAFKVVHRERGRNHSCTSHNRLRAQKDLLLVRERGGQYEKERRR